MKVGNKERVSKKIQKKYASLLDKYRREVSNLLYETDIKEINEILINEFPKAVQVLFDIEKKLSSIK